MGPWLQQLVEFGNAVARLGGEVHHSDSQGQQPLFPSKPKGLVDKFLHVIGMGSTSSKTPPYLGSSLLSTVQRNAVEKDFGGKLSTGMNRLLDELGTRGFYSWYFPKNFPLPGILKTCTWGRLEWYFDHGITAELRRTEWVKGVFSNPDDPYDKLWYSKVGLFNVANGDVWAIDPSSPSGERVIYLDHEGGDGHGTILAENITALMDNWTRIGCVGSELWLLKPFLDSRKGIDGFGSAAREFRSVVGLSP